MMKDFQHQSAHDATHRPGTSTSKERAEVLNKVISDATKLFDATAKNLGPDGALEWMSGVVVMSRHRRDGGPKGLGKVCSAIHDLRLCDCCIAT